MPLMRIRSVEIIFEDDLTCTDTCLLDRNLDFDSDDSTKCVDDLDQMQAENDDSVTLNAEAYDLSDDNSYSTKDVADDISQRNVKLQVTENRECNRMVEDALSLNVSELGDSGRFTEEASSSHIEIVVTYDDAVLSKSFDAVNVDDVSNAMSIYEVSEVSVDSKVIERLYEYVDSNSDSSDSTAVCDGDNVQLVTTLPDVILDENLSECNDLQYDSFVDIGKF